MIQVHGLTKRYGSTLALDRLTVEIPEGSVFGLLGPNASGKSTLIKLLMGFIFPDGGHIDLGNLSPSQIGYVPERPQFSTRFSIYEYLQTIGQLSGLRGASLRQAIDARLSQLGLATAAHWRISTCSKGMLQRLALAQALINNSPLLLLDEPMSGLDPASTKDLRTLIQSLPSEGKTVIFSTHRLSEASQVCTHIAILNHGRLIRSGALDGALSRRQVTIRVTVLADELCIRIAALHPDIVIQENAIVLKDTAVSLKPQILRALLDAQADIRSLEQSRTNLEELYLEAMRT